MPRDIRAAYEAGTRAIDGAPGEHYWQNSAGYKVDVHFLPQSRLLKGSETITYYNNSPDTLQQVWFKLYPNLYKKGTPRDSRIRPKDLTNGVDISRMKINGRAHSIDSLQVRGTNMIASIPALIPDEKMTIRLAFSYTLNKTSQIRTGQVEPGADFVAYFIPRIAVYDDIDGWNKHAYTGSQEFYNDFCNFDVQIHVPSDFVVWATGTLQNRRQVLANKYVKRLNKAEKNDQITTIIDSSEASRGGITAQKDTNSWHFIAKNVTEFVFATSDHYMWKSSSVEVDPQTHRRTRVDAVFDSDHEDYYEVIDFARKTVHAMSYDFPKWPYPYPHETIFDGLSQMEYPMMVNDNPLEDRKASIELTDHEIFHTMFPFYMGTNETKYAWMDEGWATIGEWLISSMIDSTIIDNYGMDAYDSVAGTEQDSPIMTLSTQQSGTPYYLNSYPKPAMGYLYIKDMLGDSLFTKGLHNYISNWHGKHPIPYDFFYSMNEGTGHNLNWFWKRWFFDDGYPDLAIANVKQQANKYRVVITSKGTKPVPVHLRVMYKDSTEQKFHRSIAVWKNNNATTITFKPSGPIRKIMLGAPHDADIDDSNNVYKIQ